MFIISLINTGRRMFNLCPLLYTAAFDTAYHDEGERGQKGNVKTRDKISISPSSENIWARVTEWSTSFFFFICFLLLWGKQPTSMSQPMGCITWLKQVSHFHQWVYYQKSDTQNCNEIIIHILKHKNQKDQIERSMFDRWWFTSFIHGNTATIRKQFFNMTLK